MANQLNSKEIDILARLIRYKMIYWEWSKILDNMEKESWTPKTVFEALSTPAKYQVNEHTQTVFYYTLSMGGQKFLLFKDPVTCKIKVYYPSTVVDFKTTQPFLEFASEFLEEVRD